MKRLLLLPLLLALSCNDIYVDRENASPTSPSGTNTGVKIEYRVFGTQLQQVPVTIRHTSSQEGMANLTGAVPYLFSFTSTDSSTFVFVEASALPFSSTATLQVQIFVDGKMFRESASSGFSLYASASGTYRR